MKVIKLPLIFLCYFSFSCNYHCITIGNIASNKNEIVLYAINESGINGINTETHELVITNYKNGSFTTKELFGIAQSYIDTAKNKNRISSILFYGQERNGCMPDLKYTEKGILKKAIVEFGFDNAFRAPESNTAIQLHNIFIFKNGDFKSYYKINRGFDSVLNSTIPLKNK